MKKLLTSLSISLVALAASAQTTSTGSGQAWPDKAVTLVVPFPAGGSTDQVARAIGPKLTEAGVKNVEVTSWQAIVAPKGMPPAVREKAHAAFVEALNDPAVKEQFTSIGFEMVANTPAQFAAFQQAEYARWKTVIETGKISIE